MSGSGFFINQASEQPIYYQLYLYLIDMIRSGCIKVGEKLPGKRSAAALYGISVNTVLTAYQMLAAEGYITPKERSGYIVNRLGGIYLPQDDPPAEEAKTRISPVEENANGSDKILSFSTSGIDLELFPLKTWTRLQKEILSGGENLFSSGSWQGEDVLRRSISGYLNNYRGANCEASRIVIGAGLEVLVGMLARLFPKASFAVENPGYRQMGTVLANNGVNVLPVEVDKNGMESGLLEESGADIAYLTPSHQFPTGAVMPVGRRMEMLDWANNKENRYIIEDDYDSEFRFSGRPLPCLQGLDTADKVIYAGTFSRSLAPGLRVAYLVLPPQLMEKWKGAYGGYSCTVSRPEQHCLASFISHGHFSRGINRARLSYKEKRNLLIEEINRNLKSCKIINEHTGLYLILFLEGKNAAAVSAQARKLGLLVRPLSAYRHDNSPSLPAEASSLVLGYGGLKKEDIPPAAALLAKAAKLV